MNLIGQYDSPFVRRVGIALKLYGLPFAHTPWSVFGDADKIKAYNPLIRVPVLVLDNGLSLIESHAILDYLDSLMPESDRLFPAGEPMRHHALRIAALATGVSDKVVSLFYEKVLHAPVSDMWVNRCQSQIAAALDILEQDRAHHPTDFWFGDRPGHADITVACCLRHLNEAHPGLVNMEDYPALARTCATLEALPVFKEISQPFIAPA